MDTNKQQLLKKDLEDLRNRHSDLDRQIKRATHESTFNQLAVQRLKKEKLGLKDQIEKMRSQLLPDIIA